MFRIFLILISVLSFQLASAQHPSPESFLGYPLGSQFAYHHRIVAYFEEMAKAYPSRVKLLEYGRTTEDRPLIAAVITSEENFQSLEHIRQQHLQRIGLLEGSPSPGGLPIAWLSYNVHGNEASSANTSMMVLHDLLDPENAKSKDILRQSVIIIDPCSNPDGYARYTHWYQGIKNNSPDLNPIAREHDEPWPGGRFNHYLFDLNRDWAWQTQKETKARVALYNQWMPHIHADFHEMGSNRSYYFPPAARPIHNHITPWQLEFNAMLGKYCRTAFDKKGWRYFTRSEYDLFYPSYGDTWPTFNGAIGVTFEQGGGAKAGLGIYRENERDTLTLNERIAHHYATSMATLETMISGKDKLQKEFISYHTKARQDPPGSIKTYIVQPDKDPTQIDQLVALLTRQNIKVGSPQKNQTLKVTDLNTGTPALIKLDSSSLLISAYQSQSNLVRVLFETSPDLEDSLTYDLTSWGLGYQFGLNLYGSKEVLLQKTYIRDQNIYQPSQDRPYAFIAAWNGLSSAKFLAELLQKNILVRTTNSALQTDSVSFERGALIITKKGNEWLDFGKIVAEAAQKHGIVISELSTGFITSGIDLGHDNIRIITAPKVLTLAGEGVSPTALGELWHFFETQLQYPLSIVNLSRLEHLSLERIDVLILPDGSYAGQLSDATLNKLTEWIKEGGRLIAMENATDTFLNKAEFGLSKKEAEKVPDQELLRQYDQQERQSISKSSPGSFFQVQFDPTHPLSFGWSGSYYALVRQAYNRAYLKDGWNVGYLQQDNYRAGFVGSALSPKLEHTLLYGTKEIGRGQVIFMMDNPLFRSMLYKGKILFTNAVFR
ncbi:M14 family metallopeptidase [Dyadobacter tibetensis]|uniref:M14 family metallopeptidase n=1 Tax=Dyadobacter tibetensis TaxID=1211851 RepID=UPI00046FF27D|nr:M14 family metallopeptidase [Dyadobacter tibetensis]